MTDPTIHELLDRLEIKVASVLAAKSELMVISPMLGRGFGGAYERNHEDIERAAAAFGHYQNEMRWG